MLVLGAQVANGGGAVANDDDFDDGFGDFGDGGFADTTVHDTPAVEPADADTRGDVVASLTWQPHEGRVTVALNIAEAAVNTAVNAPPPSADGVASAQQRVLDELMAALTINDDRIVLAITQVRGGFLDGHYILLWSSNGAFLPCTAMRKMRLHMYVCQPHVQTTGPPAGVTWGGGVPLANRSRMGLHCRWNPGCTPAGSCARTAA